MVGATTLFTVNGFSVKGTFVMWHKGSKIYLCQGRYVIVDESYYIIGEINTINIEIAAHSY